MHSHNALSRTSSSSTASAASRLPAPRQLDPELQKRMGAASCASTREAIYDAELVRRYNGGDEAAFAEIIERYRERIFLVALTFLRNRADAEEIAQDTFVRAYRGLARFRGDSSLATWLHRIAVNLARNRYWYFFRRRRHATLSFDCALTPESDATFADLFATGEPGPDREAVSGEFTALVSTCMEKLAESHREILTLRTVLNHSYSDIAERLGISVGTVKSRIARARTCLRKFLVEACPEFTAESAPADWLEPNRSLGSLQYAS